MSLGLFLSRWRRPGALESIQPHYPVLLIEMTNGTDQFRWRFPEQTNHLWRCSALLVPGGWNGKALPFSFSTESSSAHSSPTSHRSLKQGPRGNFEIGRGGGGGEGEGTVSDSILGGTRYLSLQIPYNSKIIGGHVPPLGPLLRGPCKIQAKLQRVHRLENTNPFDMENF